MALPRMRDSAVDARARPCARGDSLAGAPHPANFDRTAPRLNLPSPTMPPPWSRDGGTGQPVGADTPMTHVSSPPFVDPVVGAHGVSFSRTERQHSALRARECDYTALGLSPESSAMPPGWTVNAATGFYVHNELVIALFAHPGHMRSVTGSMDSEHKVAGPWSRDTYKLLETLPVEDKSYRHLLATLFSESDFDGRLERVFECHRNLKKLAVTLDTSKRLFLAGDRPNAIKFRDKVSGFIPECITHANYLFEAERYLEALDYFKIAAVVYVAAGKRFRVALGQILDRISWCFFNADMFTESLRFAEHALYAFVTSGNEVEWALLSVVRNMGKCFRAMGMHDVALISFNFCVDSVNASDYVCVAAKQKVVVDGYDTCALLWIPDTDAIFLAETKMLIALSMMQVGRVENGLVFADLAHDMYVASGDEVRPIHALLVLSIACYDVNAYRQSVRYAKTVYGYTEKIGNKKLQAVALFYGAHSMAMCGLYNEASLMFRLLQSLPQLTDTERRGIPPTLMFAECLIQMGQTTEAISVLKSASRGLIEGPERTCYNLLLTECFLGKTDLRNAAKHFLLAQGSVPAVFEAVRDRVKVQLELLEHKLNQQALQASLELCPGFNLSARHANVAAERRKAREHVAPEWVVRLAAPECCVCLAADATVAFSPCFHRCVCLACSAGILAQTRECPMCRSATAAAHEILDDGAPCAGCKLAPRAFAVAPCFHLQFCGQCALAPAAASARCAACSGAVTRMHRVFG